jgi:hypothetical protein
MRADLKFVVYSLIVILVICNCINPQAADASGNTARQKVTVTVLPIRALYIDDNNTIIAIFSNVPTITEEKLQVFANGLPTALTDKILAQYKMLQARVDWRKVGWVYLEKEKSIKR